MGHQNTTFCFSIRTLKDPMLSAMACTRHILGQRQDNGDVWSLTATSRSTTLHCSSMCRSENMMYQIAVCHTFDRRTPLRPTRCLKTGHFPLTPPTAASSLRSWRRMHTRLRHLATGTLHRLQTFPVRGRACMVCAATAHVAVTAMGQ